MTCDHQKGAQVAIPCGDVCRGDPKLCQMCCIARFNTEMNQAAPYKHSARHGERTFAVESVVRARGYLTMAVVMGYVTVLRHGRVYNCIRNWGVGS